MLVFSLLAVAFSSVFVHALATCTRTYIVKDGDICDSISAANNCVHINHDCTNLLPGQPLCLGHSGKDCTTTYVVKPNDDCNIVSSAYNINATVLSHNNPQLNADCSNMYIGEVCVPNESGGQPPATTIPATAKPAKPYHTGSPDHHDDDDDDLPWCD
ncbi:hypothetical protein EDB85DRAFT_2131063 [Lactarius pseudohatsudake]|nr:hypothetical protein EDB85DRAFT_2131063 [Lactarius pseudohatsudake]